MRNLKLLNLKRVVDKDSLAGCQQFTIDTDTNTLYAANETSVTGIDIQTGQVCSTASLRDGGEKGEGIGMHYLPDQQGVCLAMSSGNLLLWSVHTGEMECVGSVESGFTAMAWSPDMERLVLATGDGTLILMTREFDAVIEVSQNPLDSGEAAFVTVGWGKKETQFHGSQGKEAAQQKTQSKVSEVSSGDDRCPRISWRGDGQFFAVSSVNPTTGARQVHVWSRECGHHSTSEPVDGLEQPLAWKPSGSLVASTQSRPNKHDVVFFEKNGLRHGEFTLPFKVNSVKVREVLWNMESTVLVVWSEEETSSHVQLWTMNNYHWYLKQTLDFPADQRVVDVQWDLEHGYRLHIVCCGGQYLQYTWCWATCHSAGMEEDDMANVAVIDGKNMLMTPMRKMVVPPPMSAYQLELYAPVNHVTFGPLTRSNDVMLVLANNDLVIYKLAANDSSSSGVKLGAAGGNGFSVCCHTHTLDTIIKAEKFSLKFKDRIANCPLNITHVQWLTTDIVILCLLAAKGDYSVLLHMQLKGDELTDIASFDVEGSIQCMAASENSGALAVQLGDGSVLKYCPDTESLVPWELDHGRDLQFPYVCTQMSVCTIGSQMVVLGLTDRFRFYVNDVEIASNCTSYGIHDEFLLLTTLSHTCRCISRLTKVHDLPMLSDGKEHPFDESHRRVERGSRIVAVVPEDTKLILQMPRGNLEAIHPRALVLSAVRKHLSRRAYKTAFLSMRKHRINMNLMYDHDPKLFFDHVNEFISQVDSVNHLNLFLTDLQEEDVTQTMYTAAYRQTPTASRDKQGASKVDRVCDCVREAVAQIDPDKYLLTTVTAHVRKTQPELEKALSLIKQLRDEPRPSATVSAEDCLKYLLFLVDVNQLYDIALGTYDFDLVLMVAEKSNKDPKEYIPFLNKLRRMEEHYQKFTIDKHLRRHRKALVHIAKCGEESFEECLSHTVEHKLYVDALKLFKPASQHFKRMATCYGGYLCEKHREDEAGVMYVRGEEWELAFDAFKVCLNWRQMFCMAACLGYTADREVELARQCARQLQSNNRHAEAAIVFEQYAKDVEESIVCLVEGGLWDEALRMMYRHKRTDFIETNLRPGLSERCVQHHDSLEEYRQQFERHRTRLHVVRHEQERQKLEVIDGEGGRLDSDLFSDTSSATGASVMSSLYDSQRSTVISRMSGRTSKSRKRGETKRWSLKEGSQFEDCALIDALAKLITHIDSLKEEINSLMKALVQFNQDEEAQNLQLQYEAFLTLIDQAIPDIWPAQPDDSDQPIPTLGPNMTANAIAQAMQQGRGIASTERKEAVLFVPPKLRKETRWRLHMVQTAGD